MSRRGRLPAPLHGVVNEIGHSDSYAYPPVISEPAVRQRNGEANAEPYQAAQQISRAGSATAHYPVHYPRIPGSCYLLRDRRAHTG